MRKSFLTKAVVAVGVMVSAMALSSMAVFAESKTYNLDVSKDTDFFTICDGATKSYKASYTLGSTSYTSVVSFANGIKYENNTLTNAVSFSLSESDLPATLHVVAGGTNDSKPTTISLYKKGESSYTSVVSEITETLKKNAAAEGTINITEAGDYALARSNSTRTNLLAATVVTENSVTTYSVQMGDKTNYPTYPTAGVSPTNVTEKGTTVKVSWAANDTYAAGEINVTLTDEMLSGTSYTVPYSVLTGNLEEKEVANIITSDTTITFNANDVGTIAEGGVVKSYLTLTNGAWQIDENNKTYNGTTYTHRLKSSGARSLSFSTNSAAYIEFEFLSQSSDARTFTITSNEDATFSLTGNALTNQSPVVVYKNYLPSAGTYTLSTSNGIAFYSIKVTPVTERKASELAVLVPKTTFTDEESNAVNKVSASYTTENANGYLILEFDSDYLADVDSLSYNGIDISTVYSSVKFVDGSIYSKDGKLLYAMPTDKDMSIYSITGTVIAQ